MISTYLATFIMLRAWGIILLYLKCNELNSRPTQDKENKMSNIDVTTDTYTCRQEDDLAVITLLEGADILSTTIRGKDDILELLNMVNEARHIKGVAVIYSDQYRGDAAYKKFMIETIEGIDPSTEKRFTTIYKYAILQFLKRINSLSKPIVGGMSGDIGPISFAMNLAFDLRVSTDDASYFHPNLKLGLPPEPLLAYYFIESLGHHKTTELFLTKQALTAQDAFDMGLITQVVSSNELKKTCLDQLRQLSTLSGKTLIETRCMLQPNMDGLQRYINRGFDSAIRCMYNMKEKS
jgi:1,4-dihydroxy-2-naphthoyl-CoA synthase